MEYWIIAGTRDFTDKKYIYQECYRILANRFKRITIIAGGARGVDTIAIDFAKDMGIPWVEIPAKWTLYGERAGHIRNQHMADYAKNKGKPYLIAFWDQTSTGTKDMIDIAQREGFEIFIIKYKDNGIINKQRSASMLFKNKKSKK